MHDRVRLWRGDTDTQASLYIEYAGKRRVASEYSFSEGNEDMAVHTLSKARGYLMYAHRECAAFGTDMPASCHSLQPLFLSELERVITTATEFSQKTHNEALRAQVNQVLDKSLVLWEQMDL